ncbi:MAG: hypothetical protein AB2L14_25240 [Candidatus Xenobiia bacterium LiM19]
MAETETTGIGYVPYTQLEVNNLLAAKLDSTAKAADSDLLDGHDSAYFRAAGDTTYIPLPFTMKTDDFSAAVNNAYGCNKSGSICVATLPAVCAVGDVIEFSGYNATLFKVVANTGQIIYAVDLVTKTAGYVATKIAKGGFRVVCMVANTEWEIRDPVGKIGVETS